MRYIFTFAFLAMLCACAGEDGQESSIPDVIRISLLPDRSIEELHSRYMPLVDYLGRATSLEFELVFARDYTEMIEDFDAGRLHLVRFGGLTFVQAESRSRAEPLVMRDVDREFTSCYLVSGSDARGTVDEFAGDDFSFGPRLSTSGHLMPRHFLGARGLVPERLFASVQYSSGHDQTAASVRDGTVAIGVANCIIARSMLTDGRLGRGDVRILETTPPYPNYVWAVAASMDEGLKTRLRDAFLALDPMISEHLALLQAAGANGYLPAGREDFEEIRRAARDVGLLAEGD